MNHILPRMILCLCLSLLMAVAGVQGALACGGRVPVTALVICGHAGAETIWLDAQGQPVPKAKGHCPDCLGTPAATLADPQVVPAFIARDATALSATPAPAFHLSAKSPSFLARGPPRTS
ncbi:hypothetical protein [Fuscibacter oryzae]|uniref:DUF2946 domain-containing protein n=1 Tax=Fuscibacter oryzae TaxID=2803939 RepID=A0A8J7MS18_9RHOB|nr:hypothetical protein [Fuscibacter oryzae]MBL4928978.1 hypothetical protein [Fuscibacter oryzae]